MSTNISLCTAYEIFAGSITIMDLCDGAKLTEDETVSLSHLMLRVEESPAVPVMAGL